MNIGLTQRILHYNNIAYDCLEHGWYTLLSGHTLSYIPNRIEHNFDHMVQNLDMVIFTGGDASPKRLVCETKLLTSCYTHQIPVLGVCHGAFFINQMEQGINDTIEGHAGTEHEVVMDNTRYQVNSFHNNCIRTVGKDLTPIAQAEDNSIEAFQHRSRLVWGLAWHPERMTDPVLPKDLRRLLYDRHD